MPATEAQPVQAASPKAVSDKALDDATNEETQAPLTKDQTINISTEDTAGQVIPSIIVTRPSQPPDDLTNDSSNDNFKSSRDDILEDSSSGASKESPRDSPQESFSESLSDSSKGYSDDAVNGASNGASAEILNEGDSDKSHQDSSNKKGGVKRKAERPEEQDDNDDAKPAKKQKTKATPKSQKPTSKGKGKKAATAEPAEPKKKRINKALKQKIQQVLDFLTKNESTISCLDRSEENKDHVIVKESALIGALMSLRADYEMSDPRMASLIDVEDVTVREFAAPVGTQQVPIKYIVIDLSKPTVLETSVQQKIENWGLGAVSLLEAELEMYAKQLEEAAVMHLLEVVESVE